MMFSMCPEAIGLDISMMSIVEWEKSKCNNDVLQMMTTVPSKKNDITSKNFSFNKWYDHN